MIRIFTDNAANLPREDIERFGVVPTWIYPDVAAVLNDLKKERGI